MNAFRCPALLAAGLGLVAACSVPDRGDSGAGEDCHVPLEFSSRTYEMVMGAEVGTVAPGGLLGTGEFQLCDDGGGAERASRQVYALPGVPPGQAVVLLGDEDRGAVFVRTHPPVTAWHDGLVALLDAWSFPRPGS